MDQRKDNQLNSLQAPNPLNDGDRRVLAFRGVSNFRDLGGYPTEHGDKVRWGVLYRSGHLGKMKAADRKLFEKLDIDTLIDFRSDRERRKNINRLPVSQSIQTILVPILDLPRDELTKELREAVATKNLQSFDPSEKMMGLYRNFVVENVPQFRQFIQVVLAAQGKAVLWHCVAGKDRTGFAAAVLLRILSVPHEIVVQDYMLSAKYADRRKPFILMLRLFRGKEFSDLIQTFYTVRKEWLQAAFQAIDDIWWSFDQYRLEALNVSQDQVNQLRHYLVDGTAGQKRSKS